MYLLVRLLAVLFAIPATGASQAQTARKVEVALFGGYQAGGSITSRFGQLVIDDAPAYGVAVDVRVRPDATIQLLYDRQDTVLDFRDNDPFRPKEVRASLSVEYFHLGGTIELGGSERLRPYFAMTLGASRFHPKVEEAGDEWRVSMGVALGFKSYLSDRFGIRAEGRVWPTFLNTSGGLFCSLPGGCLASVESDFFVQGNATAGFFVTF